MRYLHPKHWFRAIRRGISNFWFYYLLPDGVYLKWKYKKTFNTPLNLKDPQKFTEKIQWLKLHDRNECYCNLVDKYKVKEIVAKIIGEEYIIPTIGGKYTKFSQLDKDKLPDSFVIKCNHDSASVVVCEDKQTFNWDEAERCIMEGLSHDYYHWENKQWAYKNIDRCFFIEKCLEDSSLHDLPDYKFFCFNGTARCVQFVRGRRGEDGIATSTYFTTNWEKLPFEHYRPSFKGEIPRPKRLGDMVELAEKLARYVGNPFTRIDLYEIDDRIYFGEITFYPAGGMGRISPVEWDYKLGSWMDLSSLGLK